MGMHQPGWREANEERAWEEWEQDAKVQLSLLRAAADRLSLAIERRDPHGIMDAVQDIDGTGEAIFAVRHGPENPADA